MKRSICLLFLILTACAPLTSYPTPTDTPTLGLTSTPVPTSTPANTPTPDAMHQVFDALLAEGINVEHRVPALGWELIVNGAEVPGAYFDEDGKNLHILVGDNEINVPADQAANRLFLSEDGVLGFKGEDGSTLAAFGPQLTTETLAGKWFTESEVIGTPDSPIFIGDDIQDHLDFLHAEKLFLEPFPADVYYPEQSKIVRTVYDSNDPNPVGDFSWKTPFGKLSPEDLDKSPFKIPTNVKILQGPYGFKLIISEQVYDPSDPQHIQEFSFEWSGFKTLAEAQQDCKQFSYWQKNGYILLPKPRSMRTDYLSKYPWGKNLLYFLGQQGYVDSAGNVDTDRIIQMVDRWFSSGRISPELEEVLILATNKYIRR